MPPIVACELAGRDARDRDTGRTYEIGVEARRTLRPMEDGWDDERVEDLFTRVRAFQAAMEAVTIGEMEFSLESTPDAPNVHAGEAPRPGDWHPFYEPHRGWLTNWLDTVTSWQVRIPIPPPMRGLFEPSANPMDLLTKIVVLSRRRAYGMPYPGGPAVCTYWTAVDEHGRWIASSTVTPLR